MYPVLTEIMGDKAATATSSSSSRTARHQTSSYRESRGPTLEKYNEWRVDAFEKAHGGARNKFKTMYLQGDTKAEVVGANMQQNRLQGPDCESVRSGLQCRPSPALRGRSGGELARIDGRPGNFATAMRISRTSGADPTGRTSPDSLEAIIPTPSGAQLWYTTATFQRSRMTSRTPQKFRASKARRSEP